MTGAVARLILLDAVRPSRLAPARTGGRPGVIFAQGIDGSGPRINVTLLEDYAFWAWASIEVLGHRAMRIREMLELIHRSFIAYTVPGTSEVIPLLQTKASLEMTMRNRRIIGSMTGWSACRAVRARRCAGPPSWSGLGLGRRDDSADQQQEGAPRPRHPR